MRKRKTLQQIKEEKDEAVFAEAVKAFERAEAAIRFQREQYIREHGLKIEDNEG